MRLSRLPDPASPGLAHLTITHRWMTPAAKARRLPKSGAGDH